MRIITWPVTQILTAEPMGFFLHSPTLLGCHSHWGLKCLTSPSIPLRHQPLKAPVHSDMVIIIVWCDDGSFFDSLSAGMCVNACLCLPWYARMWQVGENPKSKQSKQQSNVNINAFYIWYECSMQYSFSTVCALQKVTKRSVIITTRVNTNWGFKLVGEGKKGKDLIS